MTRAEGRRRRRVREGEGRLGDSSIQAQPTLLHLLTLSDGRIFDKPDPRNNSNEFFVSFLLLSIEQLL